MNSPGATNHLSENDGMFDDLLAKLGDLTHTLRAHTADADRLARLPEPVVRALVAAGLFRLWIPRSFGGFELELPKALRLYEAAARVDGSAGWAVMIGSGGGLFAAYLEPATAAEIYERADAVIAGSGSPDGQAEQVAGGYRVTGRWRYASGADYATTFTANCVVTAGGKPVLGSDGKPLIRAMAFEPAQVSILPTWNSSGMRGTGSHDFEVKEAFVPQRRSFSVFTDVSREPGPLYRLPFGVLSELPVAAVGVGVAQHALDAFAALASRKKGGGSHVTLSGEPIVQSQYAESHARCRFARARLHELAQETWQVALSGRPLDHLELAEITAGCALCVSELCVAINQLARFVGMSAISPDEEFARAWRDLQTLGAHMAVSPRQLTSAGAVLLTG